MGKNSAGDFAVSIITFHEQVIGAHARIQRAANEVQLLEGYDFLQRAFLDYSRFPVLGFDEAAHEVLSAFTGSLRVNQRDLRIASIAISNGLILLTGNRRDFERIPGLTFEDWTAA